MTRREYDGPLDLPAGFRIHKQVDLFGQWEYAASHFGWASRWFESERRAVKAARDREGYLRRRGLAHEVFP